jgi:transposase
MVAPPRPCPECGQVMNGNCLPKHRRARHGERGEGLLPSHDEQVRMIELYVKGWTQRAIADVVCWSPSTVSRVLSVWGERRPGRRARGAPPKLGADTVLAACQLYGQGHSVSAVAAMLGLSTSAVYRRLLAGGAERRNAGRAAAATRLGTTLDEYQAQRKSRRASAARRKRSTAREAS